MDQNDANRGMSHAPKEFLALTHGQEWVSFYESFDKLVQDHLARSSELLRRAMTLPEVADREVAQVRSELESRLAAERQRSRELLAKLSEEISASHQQVTSLARAVGGLVAELESLGQRVTEALASYDAADKAATVWAAAPLNGSAGSSEMMPAAEPADVASTAAPTAPGAAAAATPSVEGVIATETVTAESPASADGSPEAEPADAVALTAMAASEVELEQPATDAAASAGTGLIDSQATTDAARGADGAAARPHWLSVTRMASRP